LRNVYENKPFRIFPNYFGVGKGEFALQSYLQMLLNEMMNSGEIDKIDKYEKYSHSFYRLATPYTSDQKR